MKAAQSLLERIDAAAPSMTRSERLLSTYLRAHVRDLALETAASIARKSGVSPMTVSRFLRTLGYESFDEIRREAIQLSAPTELRLGNRFAQFKASASPAGTARATQFEQEVDAILSAYDAAKGEHWDAMVHDVAHKEHVQIVGYQTVRGLAADFAARLEYVREDVRLLDGADGTYASLLGSSRCASSCLIVIDIRRYARQAQLLAAAAAEVGIPVYIVTDSYCHWARSHTPRVFSLRTNTGFFWDSTVAITSLLNLLMNDVVDALGETAGDRFSRLEALQGRFDQFLD